MKHVLDVVNGEKSGSGADFYVKGETSASDAGGDAFVVHGEMSISKAVIDEGTSGEMRHKGQNEIYVGGGKSEHVLTVVNGETSGSARAETAYNVQNVIVPALARTPTCASGEGLPHISQEYKMNVGC